MSPKASHPRRPAGAADRPSSAPPNGPGSPEPPPGTPERRRNRPLREALDELIYHAREISRRAKAMTPAELDYAQQRLEWMADEVWRVATGEATPPE